MSSLPDTVPLRKVASSYYFQQWFHSYRIKMAEIGSGDDTELIFFAILFMLNILCDIIHDVIDKHVHVRWI